MIVCKKKIEIAPLQTFRAAHKGFEQLAIIEKKNKNWKAVIELCNQAKEQGWLGDWDKRIAEARKHI